MDKTILLKRLSLIAEDIEDAYDHRNKIGRAIDIFAEDPVGWLLCDDIEVTPQEAEIYVNYAYDHWEEIIHEI